MNTVPALLSLFHLRHLSFLRPRLLSRAPARPRAAASMQIERNVGQCRPLRDTTPSSTLLRPTQNDSNVEELFSPLPAAFCRRSLTCTISMSRNVMFSWG